MGIKTKLKKFSMYSWILIAVGTLTWSLTMVKSGIVYGYGMGFWGPNGHDGVWHIAIINSLKNGTWQMPIFAGESIRNYHIGFDLLVAVISKLTGVTPVSLYFQIIPTILAMLIGIFAYKFVYVWRKSKTQALWATFFVYFGGSFGWVVTLLRSGRINGESLFWSQQSVSTLINPPFALSILLIFIGLHQFYIGISHKSKKRLTLATFIFGILVQVKVYAGILILAGLLLAGIWRMLRRKGASVMKVFIGAFVVSVLIISPLSNDVGKTIIFKPFWFLETMMQFSDRVGWLKYGEAMVNYKLAGNLVKGIPAYFIAFCIFWLGNLGTRAIKEILFIKHFLNFQKLNYINIFIYTLIGFGVLIPTFFVQRGTAWNTIQFMYYSLMFSGILAGISMGKYLEGNSASVVQTTGVKILFSILVILFTIPTTIGTLWHHYLPTRPPAKISKEELEALEFLKTQPDGVVLTQPFDRVAADEAADNPPRPLYLYESTAYVSAFSEKPAYLEDEVNLEITGYEWRNRRNEVASLLNYQNSDQFAGLLIQRNIKYLYIIGDTYIGNGDSKWGIENIFENRLVAIFKVL